MTRVFMTDGSFRTLRISEGETVGEVISGLLEKMNTQVHATAYCLQGLLKDGSTVFFSNDASGQDALASNVVKLFLKLAVERQYGFSPAPEKVKKAKKEKKELKKKEAKLDSKKTSIDLAAYSSGTWRCNLSRPRFRVAPPS